MAKTKLAVLGLIVLLAVSLSFNVYQYSSSQAVEQQNQASTVRREMVSQLMHTQNNVNSKLAELNGALMAACREISQTGLTGAAADQVLSRLVENNSLIVNAATSDAKDILTAVQPSSYSGIIAEDIHSQEQNIRMQATMMPAMSNMIPLVEGFPGVVMVAPIFDDSNRFMGSLSIVVQPSKLVNESIASTGATTYSMWAMQSNGTLIYDPDPAQQGKNLLTDPIYTDYPEVQAFTQQVAAQQSGYGTYQYYVKNLDQTQNQVVSKEAYWITVGIYGTEWRLVIWNALS
jgi:hypothetical protein